MRRRTREVPYDLVVLGGGTGGLVSSLVAAGFGARVALVERERTGGDCLWTGCVPSKSLIAAADAAHATTRAGAFGLDARLGPVDLARVMDRVQAVIDGIAPHDAPERLTAAGVDVHRGDGTFTGPHALAVGHRTLRFRSAIVATGAAPERPPIPGLSGDDVLTSETVWGLRALPAALVVLGGGAIGCELGQSFARLGSAVTIIDRAGRLLPRDEPDAAALVAARLREDGVALRTGTRAVAVDRDAAGRGTLRIDGPGGPERLPFDALLVATGRRPRTAGLGLDALGVAVDGRGAIVVGDDLRAGPRHVFAVGDVTGRSPLTHLAAHHARVAAVNALLGTRRQVSPVVPRVTFTRPEVAAVGLSLDEARRRHGSRFVVAQSDLADLDRARTDGRTDGYCRLVGDPRGRLIGATVVGAAAGEVVAELAARIERGDRIAALSAAIHAYPTMAEGPARAADDLLRRRYARPLPRLAGRALVRARRLVAPAR